jgi:hypothetical protein
MTLSDAEARDEQPAPASDFDTVEELGRHVRRMAALLRAATNVEPDGREDEAWLVSMAADEAEQAERLHQTWGETPRGVA